MNQVDFKVGQRIRALRSSQGLTQTELAQLIGVTFQQIQKYESGANRVSASRLLDIARALNVPAGHFFEGLQGDGQEARGGSGSAGLPSHLGELMGDQEFLAMAQNFLSLSRHQRKAVADLVQSIARSDSGDSAPARRQGA